MNDTDGLSVVRPELLQIAEAVARDKSIEQELVVEAMEQAIQSAAKKKYGQELVVDDDGVEFISSGDAVDAARKAAQKKAEQEACEKSIQMIG